MLPKNIFQQFNMLADLPSLEEPLYWKLAYLCIEDGNCIGK
jgi:hypothetical protein